MVITEHLLLFFSVKPFTKLAENTSRARDLQAGHPDQTHVHPRPSSSSALGTAGRITVTPWAPDPEKDRSISPRRHGKEPLCSCYQHKHEDTLLVTHRYREAETVREIRL